MIGLKDSVLIDLKNNEYLTNNKSSETYQIYENLLNITLTKKRNYIQFIQNEYNLNNIENEIKNGKYIDDESIQTELLNQKRKIEKNLDNLLTIINDGINDSEINTFMNNTFIMNNQESEVYKILKKLKSVHNDKLLLQQQQNEFNKYYESEKNKLLKLIENTNDVFEFIKIPNKIEKLQNDQLSEYGDTNYLINNDLIKSVYNDKIELMQDQYIEYLSKLNYIELDKTYNNLKNSNIHFIDKCPKIFNYFTNFQVKFEEQKINEEKQLKQIFDNNNTEYTLSNIRKFMANLYQKYNKLDFNLLQAYDNYLTINYIDKFIPDELIIHLLNNKNERKQYEIYKNFDKSMENFFNNTKNFKHKNINLIDGNEFTEQDMKIIKQNVDKASTTEKLNKLKDVNPYYYNGSVEVQEYFTKKFNKLAENESIINELNKCNSIEDYNNFFRNYKMTMKTNSSLNDQFNNMFEKFKVMEKEQKIKIKNDEKLINYNIELTKYNSMKESNNVESYYEKLQQLHLLYVTHPDVKVITEFLKNECTRIFRNIFSLANDTVTLLKIKSEITKIIHFNPIIVDIENRLHDERKQELKRYESYNNYDKYIQNISKEKLDQINKKFEIGNSIKNTIIQFKNSNNNGKFDLYFRRPMMYEIFQNILELPIYTDDLNLIDRITKSINRKGKKEIVRKYFLYILEQKYEEAKFIYNNNIENSEMFDLFFNRFFKIKEEETKINNEEVKNEETKSDVHKSYSIEELIEVLKHYPLDFLKIIKSLNINSKTDNLEENYINNYSYLLNKPYIYESLKNYLTNLILNENISFQIEIEMIPFYSYIDQNFKENYILNFESIDIEIIQNFIELILNQDIKLIITFYKSYVGLYKDFQRILEQNCINVANYTKYFHTLDDEKLYKFYLEQYIINIIKKDYQETAEIYLRTLSYNEHLLPYLDIFKEGNINKSDILLHLFKYDGYIHYNFKYYFEDDCEQYKNFQLEVGLPICTEFNCPEILRNCKNYLIYTFGGKDIQQNIDYDHYEKYYNHCKNKEAEEAFEMIRNEDNELILKLFKVFNYEYVDMIMKEEEQNKKKEEKKRKDFEKESKKNDINLDNIFDNFHKNNFTHMETDETSTDSTTETETKDETKNETDTSMNVDSDNENDTSMNTDSDDENKNNFNEKENEELLKKQREALEKSKKEEEEILKKQREDQIKFQKEQEEILRKKQEEERKKVEIIPKIVQFKSSEAAVNYSNLGKFNLPSYTINENTPPNDLLIYLFSNQMNSNNFKKFVSQLGWSSNYNFNESSYRKIASLLSYLRKNNLNLYNGLTRIIYYIQIQDMNNLNILFYNTFTNNDDKSTIKDFIYLIFPKLIYQNKLENEFLFTTGNVKKRTILEDENYIELSQKGYVDDVKINNEVKEEKEEKEENIPIFNSTDEAARFEMINNNNIPSKVDINTDPRILFLCLFRHDTNINKLKNYLEQLNWPFNEHINPESTLRNIIQTKYMNIEILNAVIKMLYYLQHNNVKGIQNVYYDLERNDRLSTQMYLNLIFKGIINNDNKIVNELKYAQNKSNLKEEEIKINPNSTFAFIDKIKSKFK